MYFENKKGFKAGTIGDATKPNINKILFDVEKFIAMIESKTGKPINALVRASINSAINEINVQYSKTDYEKNLTDAVRKSSDKIRESINTVHANLKDLVQSIIDEKPNRTSAELKDELLNRTSDKFSKVYTVSRINAIAQTTSNFAFNSAQNTVFKDLGFNKIWLSQRDSKVRTSHRFADSQKADELGFFHVGNDKMQHPNAGSIASENVHCRCYLLAQKAINAPKPEPVPTAEPKPVKPRKPRTPKPKPVTPAGLNSIDDILTVSDANKYLLEKHSIENLGVEFDVNQLKIFLRELELVKNEFEINNLKILSYTKNPNAYASALGDSQIMMKKDIFTNLNAERYKWKTNDCFYYYKKIENPEYVDAYRMKWKTQRNYHPEILSDDYESLITHELGHILSVEIDSNTITGIGAELRQVQRNYYAELKPLYQKDADLANELDDFITANGGGSGAKIADIPESAKKKLDDLYKQHSENDAELRKIFISKYADFEYNYKEAGLNEFTAECFAVGFKKAGSNKYADEVVSIIKKYKGKKK